jgi:hypothetical protein
MITKCNTCDIELTDYNWSSSWKKTNRTQCKKCSFEYNKNSNPNRMYVNGKYISQSHPLYKAGNYRTFNDAAFSSFEKLDRVLEGYIYAISNPAWEGWVKIGMAVDTEDRCNAYQTSSPFRDYKVEVSVPVTDRRKAEGEAHKKAKELASEYAGEWFKISVEKTKEIIQELK